MPPASATRFTLRPRSFALLFAILILTMGGRAHAQPGQAPRPLPAPAQGYPPPAPAPAQYGYGYGGGNYYLLTMEERELLLAGEITQTETFGGLALSLWLGFGIGHAVQGRYLTTGWKFTLGEVASFTGIMIGLAMTMDPYGDNRRNLSGEDLLLVSVASLVILRVWEAIDTVVGPGIHNRKVRAARWKAQGYPGNGYGLYLAPTQDRNGGVVGMSVRF